MKAGGKRAYYDLALVLFCLLLAGGLYLFLAAGRSPGGWVVVRVNGEETERHALTEAGRYPLNGGTNLLVIADGEAWVEEADCPDKLCVHQGKIRYTGQSIVCLPNKLTVTVEDGASGGVDIKVG